LRRRNSVTRKQRSKGKRQERKGTERREGETGGVIECGVIEYGCRLIASVAMVAKICSTGDHFAVAPVKPGRTAAQDARIAKLVNATASRMLPPPADDPRLSGSTQA
jgi:hypothetical protein